jgi:hypothetical protein
MSFWHNGHLPDWCVEVCFRMYSSRAGEHIPKSESGPFSDVAATIESAGDHKLRIDPAWQAIDMAEKRINRRQAAILSAEVAGSAA